MQENRKVVQINQEFNNLFLYNFAIPFNCFFLQLVTLKFIVKKIREFVTQTYTEPQKVIIIYIYKQSSKLKNYIIKVSEICSSVHQTTGVSPYFSLFGNQMITHGHMYAIIQKLGWLNDADFMSVDRSDRIVLIREKLQKHIKQAFEKNAKHYNLRSSDKKFSPG